jgi:MoaA/NifB/PqqE/SkfB family radical SAM enzyme
MDLTAMAQSYLDRNQPSYLILFVTSACNAGCGFCFYGDEVACGERKKRELSTEEFRKISLKCGNVPYLLVSGGEPVLRDDLAEIIGYFIEHAHTQFITVPSNGLSPERSFRLFDELAGKYPGCHFRAAFSIDHHDGKHDAVRGVEGCLEKVLEAASAINELKKSRGNLTMDIVSVYQGGSVQDYRVLREWVGRRIRPDNHELHLLRPEWPCLVHESLEPEEALREMAAFRSESIGRENRAFSHFFRGLNELYIKGLEKVMAGKLLSACTAGRKFAVVNEIGQVRLCECREDILGDLRENDYDLKKILRKSAGFLKYMNRSGCSCTWECAVSCNIVCDPAFLPRLVLATVRQRLLTGRPAV